MNGEIEVDETVVYMKKFYNRYWRRRRFNRRLYLKKFWLIGMKERASGKYVVYLSPNRSSTCIIPIILKHASYGCTFILIVSLFI